MFRGSKQDVTASKTENIWNISKLDIVGKNPIRLIKDEHFNTICSSQLIFLRVL